MHASSVAFSQAPAASDCAGLSGGLLRVCEKVTEAHLRCKQRAALILVQSKASL
jgi:hypothetical protein